jgi:hypothetical protein
MLHAQIFFKISLQLNQRQQRHPVRKIYEISFCSKHPENNNLLIGILIITDIGQPKYNQLELHPITNLAK